VTAERKRAVQQYTAREPSKKAGEYRLQSAYGPLSSGQNAEETRIAFLYPDPFVRSPAAPGIAHKTMSTPSHRWLHDLAMSRRLSCHEHIRQECIGMIERSPNP
jgi:hypothetical protein